LGQILLSHDLFIYLFIYCCAGWGYIVAFTNVLYIYITMPLAQAGLEVAILLPLTPECWDSRMHYHTWADMHSGKITLAVVKIMEQ
jgi:hypothetical protein